VPQWLHPTTTNNNTMTCRYAALLQEALDPKEAGRHMYMSHKTHLTLRAQQQQQVAAAGTRSSSNSSSNATLWARADARYVWNASLMAPLVAAGAHAFATPVMVGYVGQVRGGVSNWLTCCSFICSTSRVRLNGLDSFLWQHGSHVAGAGGVPASVCRQRPGMSGGHAYHADQPRGPAARGHPGLALWV
jgi:hypothetical protein